MKLLPLKLSSPSAARILMATAAVLSISSVGMALESFLRGDVVQGVLLVAVSVFAAWMATAVHQFEQRIAAIDEVVRQARRRVAESDQTLAEMRQLAQRLRSTASLEGSEGERTIH